MATYHNQMQQIVAAMRNFPAVFDLTSDLNLTIRDMSIFGLGKMVTFSVPLVISEQFTDYIRNKPFVCVWLESSPVDAGCPRVEMGQGPIHFSFGDDFQTSFDDAVQEVKWQMVHNETFERNDEESQQN